MEFNFSDFSELLRNLNDEEIKRLAEMVNAEKQERDKKGKVKYRKIEIQCNKYKGSGKAWVARVNQHGKILEFLKPYCVERKEYKSRKVYFLLPGTYEICEEGTQKYDERYKLEVKEEDCTETID